MATKTKPITVYKVGGSLFGLPGLAQRLSQLLIHQTNFLPLIVCGGGATADLVRNWDQLFQLGEDRAHRLAMQSLTLNSALLQLLIPNSEVIVCHDEAEAVWAKTGIPILNSAAYLNANEVETDKTSTLPLPHTWEVTSDSIAAWVAIHWPADRLVLLKSTDLPAGLNAAAASEANLVDHYFDKLAGKCPAVYWGNLNASLVELNEWI